MDVSLWNIYVFCSTHFFHPRMKLPRLVTSTFLTFLHPLPLYVSLFLSYSLALPLLIRRFLLIRPTEIIINLQLFESFACQVKCVHLPSGIHQIIIDATRRVFLYSCSLSSYCCFWFVLLLWYIIHMIVANCVAVAKILHCNMSQWHTDSFDVIRQISS